MNDVLKRDLYVPLAGWAMIELIYSVGMFFAVIFGAAAGFCGHYCRAHFTAYPERWSGSTILDDVTSDEPISIEAKIIGAKWNDYGFWDADSNRNLIYYMVSGAGIALLAGLNYWPNRAEIIAGFCSATDELGLNSILC